MSELLLYDPERRLTAREALAHPYLNSFKHIGVVDEGINVRSSKF